MKTQATASMVASTVLVSFLGLVAMHVLASPIPLAVRPAFHLVLLVGSALALGRTTKVESVARMIGPGTDMRTAAKYLTLFAAVGLAIQAGNNALLIRLTDSTAIQGLRLYFFRFGFAPSLLTSLIVAPIGEELLFRGWLVGWFDKQGLTPLKFLGVEANQADFLSSIAFATFHVFTVQGTFTWAKLIIRLVVPFIVGLILVRSRRASGGLLIPMVCHSFCNFIGNFFFMWA